MAKMLISEYSHLALDSNGFTMPVVQEPAHTTQVVTFTTSTQSAAFDDRTRFIRVYVDTACFILFGTNPTAVTATSPGMASGQTEIFGVRGSLKVAAVT